MDAVSFRHHLEGEPNVDLSQVPPGGVRGEFLAINTRNRSNSRDAELRHRYSVLQSLVLRRRKAFVSFLAHVSWKTKQVDT